MKRTAHYPVKEREPQRKEEKEKVGIISPIFAHPDLITSYSTTNINEIYYY